MSSRERQEQRKKDFKKGIDADDARKKREEVSVTIRKSKREESLLKKRNVNAITDKKVVEPGVAQKVSISKLSLCELFVNWYSYYKNIIYDLKNYIISNFFS